VSRSGVRRGCNPLDHARASRFAQQPLNADEDGRVWIGLMGMEGRQQACPTTAQNQDVRVEGLDLWLWHGGDLTLSCRGAAKVDCSMPPDRDRPLLCDAGLNPSILLRGGIVRRQCPPPPCLSPLHLRDAWATMKAAGRKLAPRAGAFRRGGRP
jgi:hypothetical protein